MALLSQGIHANTAGIVLHEINKSVVDKKSGQMRFFEL